MAITLAKQAANATNWLGKAVLMIPGVALLGSSLVLTAPAHANRFPQLENRGPHGASFIVNPAKPDSLLNSRLQSDVPEPQKLASTESKGAFPILVPQGSHGSSQLLTKLGVGGADRGGEYQGFPRLEFQGSHGGSQIVNSR